MHEGFSLRGREEILEVVRGERGKRQNGVEGRAPS
jgi:hypothetical protein